MSGKPNTAWMKTMIKIHGSKSAVKEYMGALGSKGGQSGSTGGFASEKVGKDGLTGKERAIRAGTVGGTIGRRGPLTKAEKENMRISRRKPKKI